MLQIVPPASDDLSSDPSTSDFHVGADDIQDSDVEVESDVIRITGSDPKAAARAAAILRLVGVSISSFSKS